MKYERGESSKRHRQVGREAGRATSSVCPIIVCQPSFEIVEAVSRLADLLHFPPAVALLPAVRNWDARMVKRFKQAENGFDFIVLRIVAANFKPKARNCNRSRPTGINR